MQTKVRHLPEALSNVNDIIQYFISSVPDLKADKDLVHYYNNHKKDGVDGNFVFHRIGETEVLEMISTLKSNAAGLDNLNLDILKLCIPFLLPYITHIVNFCLINSVFPCCWKRARVIPLPKVNNPKSFKDLRPISILPVISKLLERAVASQLYRHLNRYGVIPAHQSGFRSGHSCATALLHITDDILRAWDDGKLTTMVLLDYSKAFDSLNHDILLAILNYIGLSRSSIKLFHHYLKNRYQIVQYMNNLSDPLTLDRGVPQGSILGPILFITYISVLQCVTVSCLQHFYADDSQLYLSFFPEESEQAVAALNYDLQALYNISKQHCLQLNPNKSSIITFGKPRDRIAFNNTHGLNIHINNGKIDIKTEIRNLGLLLDENLKITPHVNKCLQTCYLKLRLLYQYRHLLTSDVKLLLCSSLILPKLDFCDTVYGPFLSYADKQRVQKLQNSCLRFSYGIRKFQHISHTLDKAKWLNMDRRRYYHTLCIYHSIVIYKTPPYLFQKLNFRTDVHTLNLRFRGLLTPPLHRTQLFKRSFSYRITKLYNALPVSLKNQNLRGFKRRFRKMMDNNLI